jgi:DNA-directed RNA polymerase subunit RPC12/RpoP
MQSTLLPRGGIVSLRLTLFHRDSLPLSHATSKHKRRAPEISYDHSPNLASDERGSSSQKKKRNRALKRIDRLREKVEENHTALARGKFVEQYQPKYSIEDMDMPYVEICRRLKEANDLQIELSTKLAAMEDPTAQQAVLKKLREWEVDVEFEEIGVYMTQLKEIILQCDRDTSEHQRATTFGMLSSVETSSVDEPSEEMHAQTKEGLHDAFSPSVNAQHDFADQEIALEAGSPGNSTRNPNLERHDLPKGFVCTQCSRRFHRQEHLKRHYRSLHTRDRPFRCNSCGNRFSRSDNLAQHRRFCDD